jgi:hypothetical protein
VDLTFRIYGLVFIIYNLVFKKLPSDDNLGAREAEEYDGRFIGSVDEPREQITLKCRVAGVFAIETVNVKFLAWLERQHNVGHNLILEFEF